jgi:hypothetical protein
MESATTVVSVIAVTEAAGWVAAVALFLGGGLGVIWRRLAMRETEYTRSIIGITTQHASDIRDVGREMASRAAQDRAADHERFAEALKSALNSNQRLPSDSR